MEKLPYDFDLLYDIKYMWEVEEVCTVGGYSRSDATPEELKALFVELKMDIPDCLKNIANRKTIWICQDGSWITYKPLPDEEHKYIETTVNVPVNFNSQLKWDDE